LERKQILWDAHKTWRRSKNGHFETSDFHLSLFSPKGNCVILRKSLSQGSYPRTHQQGAYLFYTLRLKSEMRTLNCRKQKTPVNAYRTIAARHVQVDSLAPFLLCHGI